MPGHSLTLELPLHSSIWAGYTDQLILFFWDMLRCSIPLYYCRNEIACSLMEIMSEPVRRMWHAVQYWLYQIHLFSLIQRSNSLTVLSYDIEENENGNSS